MLIWQQKYSLDWKGETGWVGRGVVGKEALFIVLNQERQHRGNGEIT